MTNITVFSADNTYIGFCASGHSGYADEGSDIVCAGISALTINFINSVEKFTEDRFTVDEGDGLLNFRFQDAPTDKSRLLIKSLILGLESLKEENRDFITLDYKEV